MSVCCSGDNYRSTLDLDLDFLAPFGLGGLAGTRHRLSLGDRPAEREPGNRQSEGPSLAGDELVRLAEAVGA